MIATIGTAYAGQAESTLSLNKTALDEIIADFAGYTTSSANWTANRLADINRCRKLALSQFYTPPITEVAPAGYLWSFMRQRRTLKTRPTVSLTIYNVDAVTATVTVADGVMTLTSTNGSPPVVASPTSYTLANYTMGTLATAIHALGLTWSATVTNGMFDSAGSLSDEEATSVLGSANALSLTSTYREDYELPSTFGGMDGPITFGLNQGYGPIRETGEGMIRTDRQYGPQSGLPCKFAVRMMENDPAKTARWELMLWPRPDREYDLTYAYFAVGADVTDAEPFPLGGPQHSETIAQSCRAAVETHLQRQRGEQWNRFMERLTASILLDRSTSGGMVLGYNSDPSNDAHMLTRSIHNETVRYQGYPA